MTDTTLPSTVDIIVVGAGIVGLSTAHRLLATDPSRTVLVLEKEATLAAHQTGHNSGVLHSGVYYKPGSLKARTAVAGRTEMVRFCEDNDIAHDVCGKVIVAIDESELGRLDDLFRRAGENGIDATMIGADELADFEPHAAGIRAVHVPSTGIVDYSQVCQVLARLVEEAGGAVLTGVDVETIGDRKGGGVAVETSRGSVEANLLINCAGLQSDLVAERDDAIDDGTHIVPFRGEYYEIRGPRRSLVRNLIYPVPDPSFPFLGVHLTRMIDGSIHAGPNAVLALAREGYTWRDVSLRQLRDHATDAGLWRLGRKYWKTGAGEVWRSLNKRAFVKALQRLVPEIESDDLTPSHAGVRAQALRPTGELVDDFAIAETTHAVHVLNAPSPAATASLEIARNIVERVDARR
ncbi:MAG: L-2-hydroxyglutarate oxidase [Actinomycetia bacterium]|nr:L-2-hydroxyglutarate oxidase [Actinomycetes bacterium]MCP4959453.1 L-2-hydroxyglutarate oxidase [Actinomycetes bacterium]